jgi:UDP-N-acetylmuramoylalanine--D-glutamate ligase
MAEGARARVIPFRTRGTLSYGAWLDAGAALLAEPGAAPRRLPLSGPAVTGAHERENALAALAAAWAAGADAARAAAALERFERLPHRMQPVARVRGVLYVDDSKATNPGAAIRSLESCNAPVIWIAGGRDKDLDMQEVADAVVKRARAAVLIGEAAGKLERALAGRVESRRATSIEEAVRCAAQLARDGDVVLLAPACASQDQFRDYAERGERFRAAAVALAEGEARVR